ncbi:AsmA-like C-terminal region-containing protein [Chitinophaga oryzae]|uniref:AsmA-like C-terminal region-containing protein n=1 Tax=Chitinophaga oryzae TaxID=2725414 RepID=A0AAE7D679_9BACT|nr:AsmA-like C-terminal region-containing protein [Chitinophaga oryzae]QJB30990.1 AsmA-like C-terminal region-containing protein [Chitinophaga oryzae]
MKAGKKIIRVALISLAALLLLIGIAGGILYSQQQRLTQLAVDELNKQFAGELVLEKSSISPFSNFPYVSIALHHVRFFANKRMDGKPLYEVEKLYAGFSLPDILRGRYQVRIVVVANGKVDIARAANGDVDLIRAHAFKSDSTAAAAADSAEALSLDLKKVILKNIDVTYRDAASGWKIVSHIEKIKTSFKMEGDRIALELDSKMLFDFTSRTDSTLFRNRKVSMDLKGNYDLSKQQLALAPSTVRLENASLSLAGTAAMGKETMLDLQVKGDRPDLNLLFALVPNDIAAMMEKYRRDGRIFFDGTVKGKLSKNEMPAIRVNFGCENVWFQNKNIDRKVDSLGFKGYYTNGDAHTLKTSELHLLGINAKPGQGVFRGNFVMKDFTDPHIVMQVYSELDLKFVGEFLGIKDLEQLQGQIALKMNFKELVDIHLPEQQLAKLKEGIQSELTVTNLEFRIPNYPLPVRKMNLHAQVRNGSLLLDSIAFRIGSSDIKAGGSISDLPAIFHAQQKPIAVTFRASGNAIHPGELMLADTTHKILRQEVMTGFHIGLAFETSVQELLHPNPLPRGTFRLTNLGAAFKQYPHALHDFGADITINDTSLLVRNFSGHIDSSGFAFKGRLNNYPLWFDKIKKGRTELAFDLKSDRIAVNDLIGPRGRKFIPQGYWYEEAGKLWLRAKLNMRYDTVFKRVDARIANISGTLKQHPVQLENIKGRIRYGTNRYLVVDTLTGKIGTTDFDMNLKLYAGPDRQGKERNNFFSFKSQYLNIDELMNYDFTDQTAQAQAPAKPTTVRENDSLHAAGFNIFKIPFSNFDAQVNIGKIRYHRLWMKDVLANVHMQKDQRIKVDTISLRMAGGHIGMRGILNASDPAKLYFRSGIRLDSVDMTKMLLKFDNFGQDMVLNNNLKGKLTGHIKSHVRLHPDLTPVLSETAAQMDVEIHNGVLLDFGPMQAMSSYFKDKNLRMVRFDTLRNKLTFKNGTLEIPKMNINSSLGYIEVSGNQSLNLQMNYYLRVPMKMVTQVGFQALFGRKREEVDADQVDAIESIDKGKKGRFMHIRISGTPDKYKVGLGKQKNI